MNRLFLHVLVFVIALGVPVWGTYAQSLPPIIRDTEIENTLHEWMAPLLRASGMGENSVNIVLVQSPDVNAFVAGGANIFLYTGLIEETETPEELIGVMAHELGHIRGGHLVRMRDAMERASYESILGTVLGVGAAILSGNGGAASTLSAGGASMAQRRFLASSRINESSADQSALSVMEQSGINPTGLQSFMEKLGSSELLPTSQQSEYVRTHPLTGNRIQAITTKISQSAHKDVPTPKDWIKQHERMKAKLIGFIEPGRVRWVYNDADKSVPAHYARAIAAYRQSDTTEALEEMDALLAMEPSNPYFLELKGQMLVDFGRATDAVPLYKKAVQSLPDAGLIRIDLAHAMMESRQGNHLEDAARELERALREEPRSTHAHRLLATAYGRMGQEGEAKLHLAEEALLQRRLPEARMHINGALKTLKKNSRSWIKAQDVLTQIENTAQK